MGYEFFECEGFSVLTNKWVRYIEGDIVWVIGRLGGTRRFFLDCRFRADRYGNTDGHPDFDYIVSGKEGIVFFPTPEVTRARWFKHLLTITSDLSVGLQAMHDPVVLEGLHEEYRSTLAVQTST
jgi:hypothetical protein